MRDAPGGTVRGERRPAATRAAQWHARRAAAEMADGMLLSAHVDTALHSRDVERIALRVADRLGLSGEGRAQVGIAARLHDIGKFAVPRTVLEKGGPLTPEEWGLMFQHTIVGERMLRMVEELRPVAGLVRHSHERWDGAGYPDGLRGEEIPLASRIIFCADAFHAICTDRPYRRGRSVASALAEIRRCSGTQFEPGVVVALTQVVRNDLYYGAPRRARRRSHGRLSALFAMVVLSLGGSAAAAIATGPGTTPVTGPSTTPLEAATLLGSELTISPDAGGSGSVAGAFGRGTETRPASGSRPQRERPANSPADTGHKPATTEVDRGGGPGPSTGSSSPQVNLPANLGGATRQVITGLPAPSLQVPGAGESQPPAGSAPEPK